MATDACDCQVACRSLGTRHMVLAVDAAGCIVTVSGVGRCHLCGNPDLQWRGTWAGAGACSTGPCEGFCRKIRSSNE